MSDQLHRTRTLWLCTALHAFTHMFQVALIPLYLLIQKDFGLRSEAEATFLVSALSIAYFLPSYPIGVLADRISRKKMLAVGLFMNAAAFVGLSYAPNYSIAVACVILAGLGGSFYHPAATALVARLYPDGTGRALGKVGIGASIGFFLGPIYAGWRGNMAGWRQPVLEFGIIGLIGAVLFVLLAKEERPKPYDQVADPKIPLKLFASPTLLIIFLGASLAFCFRDFAGSGMASLGSLFLQHAHGFDARQTGLTLSCIYLASVISNPIFGHLSDQYRFRWTAVVLVFAAAAIFIFPRVPVQWLLPVLAAYGFFFMASFPMVEAALMETVHDSIRGRVFGLFITIGGFIGNLSHWLVGDWVRRLGTGAASQNSYFPIFTLLAVFVLLSLLGLVALNSLRKRTV